MRLNIDITEEDYEHLIWALLYAQITAEHLDDKWRAKRLGYLAIKVRANGAVFLPSQIEG